jgi:hypothetical protein
LVMCYPDALNAAASRLIDTIFPSGARGLSAESMKEIAAYNVWCLRHIFHWPALLFYALSAVVAGIFLSDRWLWKVARLPKMVLAAFLIGHGILLSWAIFPLDATSSIWQQKALASFKFEPTDRFLYVSGRSDDMQRKWEVFHQKWTNEREELSPFYPVGLLEPPGLNISGLKSFATKDEGAWVFHAFNDDGRERLVHLRLFYGGPLHVSELLDMSAVKYYYSDRPLEDLPPQLVPFAQGHELYIYKNVKAWDYFYTADRLAGLKDGEYPRNISPGTAYLNEKDMFDLPAAKVKPRVRLSHFESGLMKFDVDTPAESFLVVADAWHPFWKARADGKDVPVLKANVIFKGVRLAPGHYELTMFFDNTPYRRGIYVSLAAWALFIVLYILAARGDRKTARG